MNYTTICTDLQHNIEKYKKEMGNQNLVNAKTHCQEIFILAARLRDATPDGINQRQLADDLFHETFPRARFQDDTAIFVWRAAWDAFIAHHNK